MNLNSMYSVNVPSWHRKEALVSDGPQTVKESLALAKQDWEVARETLHDSNGNLLPLGHLIRRMDNNVPLAIVGPDTHVLQNHEAFGFLQQFLDANQLRLETAGCLDSGRKVWTLAAINRPNVEIVKGDEVKKYLLVATSHDGTLAVSIGFTPVRVVCYNTLMAALNKKQQKEAFIRIRHSAQVVERVENVATRIDMVNEMFDKSFDGYKAIARKQVKNSKELAEYFVRVFDMKPRKGSTTELPPQSMTTLESLLKYYDANLAATGDLLKSHQENEMVRVEAESVAGAITLDSLVNNFEAGIGSDIADSRGTYWAAYNAVTQYLTHDRGRSDDSRLSSLWYGDSAKKSELALELAFEMAGVARNV